jgi:cobalt/nickel transport system permease protein
MLTLITGGALSLYASSHPDGLEWSIEKVTGQGELEAEDSGIFGFFASVQEKTAILPDYDFKTAEDGHANKNRIDGEVSGTITSGTAVSGTSLSGTSLSGIVGSVMTLLLIVGVTAFIRKTKKAS